MSLVVAPVVEFYRTILKPVQLVSDVAGMPISLLDLAACFRLCLVLRQVREELRAKHELRVRAGVEARAVEERSFVREAAVTLLVVYGGEAITAPFLSQAPSFMVAGGVPLLYTVVQALVERIPELAPLSLNTELPLSFFDGLSRAYLLCNLIPPAVLTHTSAAVATSPWTLLITSLITANAGFFLTNMFNFLQPYSLTISTPPEFQPYGWTTTDLWCAPLVTALYATLTHAQPYWADLHYTLFGWMGSAASTASADAAAKVTPVDAETARALCAIVLAGLFSVRTWKTYSGVETAKAQLAKETEAGRREKKEQ